MKLGNDSGLNDPFDIRLAASYSTLSAKLRQAANYVVSNPVDIATRSLRAVAEDSNVAPASFSRMARALNYDSFEALREVVRTSIDRRVNSFSIRAEKLQSDHCHGKDEFLAAHTQACLDNIRNFSESINKAQLNETVDRLRNARKVSLLGVLGSTGAVEHMSYMANFIVDNWALVGQSGASLGAALVTLDKRDALIVVTKPPFAPYALHAAKLAYDSGVYVVVITDTHTCEALRYASSGFIVPSDSPHFFSSYTATTFLVETIIGMLAVRSGAEAGARIAKIEQNNRRLQEVCDDLSETTK